MAGKGDYVDSLDAPGGDFGAVGYGVAGPGSAVVRLQWIAWMCYGILAVVMAAKMGGLV